MTLFSKISEVRRIFKTGLRFGGVGIATIIVYFCVMALLDTVLENVVYLSTAAYVISAVFNYSLQSQLTFGSSIADSGAVLRYLVMHGGLMGLNSALMYLLVAVLGFWLYGAQMIATCVVAMTSFGLSYLWVYR